MTEWKGGIHGDWVGKLMKQGTLADVGGWATKRGQSLRSVLDNPY